MKTVRVWAVLAAMAIASCGDGSGSENNGGGTENNGAGNNGGGGGECSADEDCPAGSTATFARPETVVCATDINGVGYCSECINDQQCLRGFACRDATYCFELPPCQTGSDCSDAAGEVHQACVSGFCDRCTDDLDCEDDEVCYSAQCATRDKVDPTCLDASCASACEISHDANGVSTGVTCPG